ncbi:ectonucleoside triphosphate diphosphohydrolase 2-like [Carcharodon carcharias]|uniref:ectonucleoside triphosphate diphosphohydrolase 2-like n=1 Tax=Carcharodon carcharias TaxID=13397 RepID=UPI001B7E9E6B|nr:ectonucleoside triphosphate diphosphohydrolase 2-like [Carcharodon carcharias]
MPGIYHLIISVALGVLGLLGIILLCATSRDQELTPLYKYGIVIDAGSSHTTLFIYKWPAGKENDTGIVTEEVKCDVEGPGISSYVADPPGAGKSLKPCLDQSVKTIPSGRHAETPLYLGATAGMRLLSLTDPEATNRILTSIITTLRSYNFNYQGAKILTGNEEGVFGWITANYLQENFIKYGLFGGWIKPAKSTVGAMDLGGASTQISFVPTIQKIDDPKSEFSLRLYGHDYKVYTHSYLCYGRDQVMKKVFSKMMLAQGYKSDIINPCMPKGYNFNYSQDFIYGSWCTANESAPDYLRQSTVTFRGSSNPDECSKVVSSIFSFTPCTHSNCAFNNVYQPEVTGSFLAFAAFYYTLDFLKDTLNKRITSTSELKEAADIICSMDFKKLKEMAPNVTEKRLVDYCTTASYIHILTTRGYKFNNETFKNISFQKKAGGSTIGWALGYMLNLTNMIPAEDPGTWKVQMLGAWAVLIVICILVIVAGVLLFVLSSRSVKNDSVL